MRSSELRLLANKLVELEKILNGGKGSGNFGHLGRKGKVGGSAKRGATSDGPNYVEMSVEECHEKGFWGYRVGGEFRMIKDGEVFSCFPITESVPGLFGWYNRTSGYRIGTKPDDLDLVLDDIMDNARLGEKSGKRLDEAEPLEDKERAEKARQRVETTLEGQKEEARLALENIDPNNPGYSSAGGMSVRAATSLGSGNMTIGTMARILGVSDKLLSKEYGGGEWHHMGESMSGVDFMMGYEIQELMDNPEKMYKLFGQQKVLEKMAQERLDRVFQDAEKQTREYRASHADD